MTSLIVKYSFFAILAIIINIASQKICLAVYSGHFSLFLAVIMGTANGLIIKYLLDKRFIFYYKTQNLSDDINRFTVYTIMGLITTMIFWAFEFSFAWLFNHEDMKFVGAIIGLSIGYTIKYKLDKHFVFTAYREQ